MIFSLCAMIVENIMAFLHKNILTFLEENAKHKRSKKFIFFYSNNAIS
jgi:hypothetical protein